MEQQSERKGRAPRAARTRSSDPLSRVISVAAVLISAAAFTVQYVAHDQLIYDVSKTDIQQQANPVRATVHNVLVVYNQGNRSGALLDANAAMIDTDPGKETPDQACDKKTGFVWLSGVDATVPGPVFGQYGSVVEAGKILLRDLRFSLPTGAASALPENAVICLDLTFSNSLGATPGFHKALASVHIVAENGAVARYDVRWSAIMEHRYPVLSETYLQLPISF